MKLLKMSLVALLAIGGVSAMAKEKRTLKGNMTLKYNVLPGEAESLQEMFTKGEWYGRLRFNSFLWDWDTEYPGKTKDN